MKPTKQQLLSYFNIYIRLMQQDKTHFARGWSLDHTACYGGYVIEATHADTSVSHPLGNKRRRLKDMIDVLEFAIHSMTARSNPDVA